MTDFVEVKTQDLSGAALDWAVAKSIGAYRGEYVVCEGGEPWPAWIFPEWFPVKATTGAFSPSADWAQGGPLIEKYGVDLSAPPCIDTNREIGWQARPDDGKTYWHSGDTPLIAACRAIVASVHGDTVSVPKELCHA